MADERFLTASGAAELRSELEHLITVKRPELAERLREAIAQGDLSENADYIDAKEQQAFLEGRILYIEGLLRTATIVDDSQENQPAPLEAQLNTEVTICADGEPPEKYRIVGAAEADPRNGKISNESPLGAALMGRRKGDMVRVQTPGGEWVVKIIQITR